MLDSQQQLLHQKGLGQVVVCTQPQPEQTVGIGITGREEQRRNIALGVQLLEQHKAIPVRQVDVQNHQLWGLRGKGRFCFGTVGGGGQILVACPSEMIAQQGDKVWVVIYQ